MNTESFWKNIVFYNDLHALPAQADSVIVVASNRLPFAHKARFMSEERDEQALHYFVACIKNGQWLVGTAPSLQAAIATLKDKDKDWVIYTEGYGKIFTTGLYRGFSLASQHQVNVLYLDYPSYKTTKGMLGNYHFALDNARQAGTDFAPVLRQVKQLRDEHKMGDGRLTLFFHSMGNNLIREIVKNNFLQPLNDKVWVDNLVLNAACVPEKDHAQWIDQITFAKRLYINYNPGDYTLGGAKLLSLSRQLGEGARGDRSSQAVYVNFNQLCGRNHSNFIKLMSHYGAHPMALAYYRALFHGKRVNIEDPASFIQSPYRKLGYSLICPFPLKTAGTKSQEHTGSGTSAANASTTLH